MAKSKYTVAVDLGESRVVAVAGALDSAGEIKIYGISKRPTQGLRAGQIENIAQINGALSSAIAELESALEIKIQQAYGGISGEFLRCQRHTESILVEEPNSGVTHSDVVALNNLMRDVEAPAGDSILEYTPENYMVDDRREIKNPVGSFGRTLSSTFNFTLCDKEALKRLNLAFMQAGITMKRCFSNSIVAAEAVLSPDEIEAGVAVVDLGEGVTNVAIYYKSALRYMISIPIGGSAINHDLQSLMIQERNIEKIKINHGCAIASFAESGSVTVMGRTHRDNRNVPLYNIAVAIEQRVMDIIIFVQREIHDAGFEGRLPYGVVLTGGGANLKYVDDLFRRHLGMDVRIASPEEGLSVESVENLVAPEYATVIGLLRRGIELDKRDEGKGCTVSLHEESEEEKRAEEQRRAEAEAQVEEEPIEEQLFKGEESVSEPELELDEEYDEEEDEGNEGEGVSRSIFGFLKKMGDKMNHLFNSEGDTKM